LAFRRIDLGLIRWLGGSIAATLFAVARLASGQNSTLTGTRAGQIVTQGFLNLRMRPWARCVIARSLAIIPVVVVILIHGDAGAASLLVASQVILSLQLPIAMVPLIVSPVIARRWARS